MLFDQRGFDGAGAVKDGAAVLARFPHAARPEFAILRRVPLSPVGQSEDRNDGEKGGEKGTRNEGGASEPREGGAGPGLSSRAEYPPNDTGEGRGSHSDRRMGMPGKEGGAREEAGSHSNPREAGDQCEGGYLRAIYRSLLPWRKSGISLASIEAAERYAGKRGWQGEGLPGREVSRDAAALTARWLLRQDGCNA